jgi:hypothetical protein
MTIYISIEGRKEPEMQNWMATLVNQVSAWPDVSTHEHRFGGVEFRLAAREIGHVHNFGIVDIPFPIKIRDVLIQSGRAERHHWLPQSGWTTVRVSGDKIDNALSLLRFSYLRVRMKSSDQAVADAALLELRESGIGGDVLDTNAASLTGQ